MTLFLLALYMNFTLLRLSMFDKFLCAHPKSGRIVNQLMVAIKWKKKKKKLTIVNTKNGGHVISQSEKRVKHIFLVYNAHPSCKIKNLVKIQRIMHKELRYIENKIPRLHVIVTLVPNTLSSIC